MPGVIVHAVPGLGRSQGGPSYSVPRLCEALSLKGNRVELYSVENRGDRIHDGVKATLCKQDLRGLPIVGKLRTSREFRVRMKRASSSARVVHAHGIWLMPNVDAGVAAERARVPLVISPRGMLAKEALNFSSLQKRVFWRLLQERAYAGAALWHATSEGEAEDIRSFGVRAPIAVIPNGIDVFPSAQAAAPTAVDSHTALYLGRIHPKKGLVPLIEAWSSLAHKYPRWRLRIVGPDENDHASELSSLASRLESPNVSIEPALYGAAKNELLANASLFVLPTLNENFGIAAAEALAAGLPTIVTKGAPWSGLVTEGCGWWIDHGAKPLAETLDKAMSLPPETRRAMGLAGRAWMTREFGWDAIADSMLEAYAWVAGQGPRPATVRLN
jgi:glycosyltransferase involved in cell wall biosynthesis